MTFPEIIRYFNYELPETTFIKGSFIIPDVWESKKWFLFVNHWISEHYKAYSCIFRSSKRNIAELYYFKFPVKCLSESNVLPCCFFPCIVRPIVFIESWYKKCPLKNISVFIMKLCLKTLSIIVIYSLSFFSSLLS